MAMHRTAVNMALKLAIVESGIKQRALSLQVEISEGRLSEIVTGRTEPTPDEQKRIAKALKRKVDDLFGVAA